MAIGRTGEQHEEAQRGPQPATAEQRAAQGRDPDGYWECRAQGSEPTARLDWENRAADVAAYREHEREAGS